MQKSYLLAATAAFALILHTPIALAQGTSETTTPPAATTTPSQTTTPPQTTTPAPAATTTPPETTTTSPAATTTTPSTDAKKTTEKKPAKKKMTRQQEIDHSIDTGTVPSRYRGSVPREYQKYIPFDKQ